MTPLLIDPMAACEIADAATSYDATSPGLGAKFICEIDHTLAGIRQFPEMAAAILPSFRRAVVQRFPFCIVYRYQQHAVQVVAVFPTRADDHRLMSRLTATTGT